MENKTELIGRVHQSAKRKLLYLPHAVRQMSHAERMISTSEVRRIIGKGDVIEDYPEDTRGHSCLILGVGDNGRPVHVVCSPKDDYLAIITAYLPDPGQWEDNFRKRKKK